MLKFLHQTPILSNSFDQNHQHSKCLIKKKKKTEKEKKMCDFVICHINPGNKIQIPCHKTWQFVSTSYITFHFSFFASLQYDFFKCLDSPKLLPSLTSTLLTSIIKTKYCLRGLSGSGLAPMRGIVTRHEVKSCKEQSSGQSVSSSISSSKLSGGCYG